MGLGWWGDGEPVKLEGARTMGTLGPLPEPVTFNCLAGDTGPLRKAVGKGGL